MSAEELQDELHINPTELVRKFEFTQILNKDTGKKSIALLGTIENEPAIIIAEKTPFDSSDEQVIRAFSSPNILSHIRLLDSNDVYHWYLALINQSIDESPAAKLSLIWPASQTHIDKYGKQTKHLIIESPDLYSNVTLQYVEKMRGKRIQWVRNILSHTVEADRIIYENTNPDTGFILLPDLKWDRKTLDSLYLVAIVHRLDIASVRDLKKSHVGWLKTVRSEIIQSVTQTYQIPASQLRLYVHYLPSYYHFHIHVTNIEHEIGGGVEIGKAILFEDVIIRLQEMPNDASGFKDTTLTYFLGENSELWVNYFSKIPNFDAYLG
ncbi:HIT-like domain-containing protein [Lipomyces japonicus]|uniref:HIT-like domain-containing protein n=1 Tax=Lipomyces japonicus TaxID=56871 RepID=UPI0034CD3DCF